MFLEEATGVLDQQATGKVVDAGKYANLYKKDIDEHGVCQPFWQFHSSSLLLDDIGSMRGKLMTKPPHRWTSRRITIFGDHRAIAVGNGNASITLMLSLMVQCLSKGIGDLSRRISRGGHWLPLGNHRQHLGSCRHC
uniref:Uncharacterized protein n=1 Tax=Romanomermis culicivorax TaxID=13658 RepID=A0A915L7U9_ROMCU